MSENYFGFKIEPFGPAPDSRFIILTPTHQEALATLVYAFEEREGWALLQGAAGLGKTTILKALLRQTGPEVTAGAVSHPATEALAFCNQIALALGLAGPFARKGLFLEEFRGLVESQREQGRELVLLIDDAHLLTPELLTEIRLLGNEDQGQPRVLNIFLSARPLIQWQMERGQERDLHQLLRRRHALDPLDQEAIVHYVSKRLSLAGGDPELFDQDALELVQVATHGVPRQINALCAHCLDRAQRRGDRRVGPGVVRWAMEDLPHLESIPGQGWVVAGEGSSPPPPLAEDNFPGPEQEWDACAHPEPRPELGPEEQALEARLMNRCANPYRGMSWWEKTTAFTVEWDNVRRRRLGVLGPAFPSFCPRWVDQRWTRLNRARQAADYQGAVYSEWVAAQYQRVLGPSLGELPLEELYNQSAQDHFRQLKASSEPATNGQVKAPYDWDDFDPQNPEHAAHADGAINEIFDLANYVCAQEHRPADDLVTEAVCQAVLPLKALQSIPKLREKVAQALVARAMPRPTPEPPPNSDHPAIII